MLTELHVFQVISAIQTVNQIGVSVKLCRRNLHAVRSVLHKTVTETAVTHLPNKSHVLFTLFLIGNLSAVQSHESHKLLNLCRNQKRTHILVPLASLIGVPGLCFWAVAGVILITLREEVSHARFIPGVPRGIILVGGFRVVVFNVIQLSAYVLRGDIPAIGQLK